MQTPGVRPYLWMLCGSGWFAAMVVFIGICNQHVAWQTVAAFRASLAAVFALCLALFTHTPLTVGTPVLWLRSVAGSLSMVTGFYALMSLPQPQQSDSLVITNAFPVWVVLLSWPMFGERPTLPVLGAVGCAVAGVALTKGADVSRFGWPHLAALVSSVFTAVAMMGLNRVKGVASLAVVVHFSFVSAAFCGMTYLVPARPEDAGKPLLPQSVVQWAELLAVGATATAGQIFLTKAFRGGPASKISVIGLSQVVMVMLWEAAVNGRAFSGWEVGGAGLVLGPVAYLMLRERRRARPPATPVARG